MHAGRGEEFKRRLQLNWDEQQALITQLREDPNLSGGRSVRYDFGQRDIPFTVVHPDGFVSSFLVYGRNLSSDGMSLLHGGYVHPGTMCRVILPHVSGAGKVVEGTVRHCRLVRDACHELGLQFDDTIDPREIIGVRVDDQTNGLPQGAGPLPLSGEVLLTAPRSPQRQILEHRLEAHGLTVRTASTAGAALDDLRRNHCDVLLHGLSLTEENGLHALREVRALGYHGALVSMTPDRRPSTQQELLDAGADEVLQQPFPHDVLVAQLLSFLGPFEVPSTLLCTTRDKTEIREVLPAYLDFAHRAADRLEQMTHTASPEMLREVTHYLRATSLDFGFVHLGAAAARVARLLDDPGGAAMLPSAVSFLAGCCRATAQVDHSRAA